MEIHQLRYFLAVAEVGSFSGGARRCHVAQPSLSQQIKKLEEELGYQLFDRLGRTIALTEAGEAMLPRARKVLEGVREIEENLKHDLEEGCGSLAVGAIPTMAPYILPRATRQFLRSYPKVSLTLREDLTEHLIDALLNGELDLAVLSTPIDHDAVQMEVLFRERFLLAVSSKDKLATKKKVRIQDLQDCPTILLDEMHCLGRQVQEFCRVMKLRQTVACHSAQLLTVQHMVALGMGVSLVPEMAASSDRQKVRTYLPIGERDPGREIAVARRTGRSRSHLVEEFIDLLRPTALAGSATPS